MHNENVLWKWKVKHVHQFLIFVFEIVFDQHTKSFVWSGSIQDLVMMDMSYDMVEKCRAAEKTMSDSSIKTSFLVGDEEFLPIKERYFLIFADCV